MKASYRCCCAAAIAFLTTVTAPTAAQSTVPLPASPSAVPLTVNTLWNPSWARASWQSSLIHDDYLYLDGGELSYFSIPPTSYIPAAILASTMRIDLKSSWSVTNVTAIYADKPVAYPYARQSILWTDGSYIYSYGGIRYYVPGCEGECLPALWQGSINTTIPQQRATQDAVETELWRLPLDAFGTRPWEPHPNLVQPNISPFQGALGTAYGNKYYALGGYSGLLYLAHDYNLLYKAPGLVSWNLDASGWQNKTSSGIIPEGYAAFGSAVGAPFGREGVLLFLGGYSPPSTTFAWASDEGLQNLSQIKIYDIQSKRFTSQTATGQVPDSRWDPCAVGVAEADTGGFDIYFLGGFKTVIHNSQPFHSGARLYVLSLPSFVWKEVPRTASQLRAAHTCQVVGKSQMLIIGGRNPIDPLASSDPRPNGIGIFDLNTWRWKSRYSPTASNYTRPVALAKIVQQTPFPKHWDSDLVKSLFYKRPPPGQNTPTGSDTNVGAIAGGVVGGIVVIAILVGVAVYYRRDRKMRQGKTKEDAELVKAVTAQITGLPGGSSQDTTLFNSSDMRVELATPPGPLSPALPGPFELGPPQSWELQQTDPSAESTTNGTEYEGEVRPWWSNDQKTLPDTDEQHDSVSKE